MAKIKTADHINVHQDVEELEPSYTAGGNFKRYSHFGKKFGSVIQPLYSYVFIQ